jgi:hypothetical protein
MRKFWRDIYQASGGVEHHRQARRVANLTMALHFHSQYSDKSAFFSELTRIAELLGGSIALGSKLKTIIWGRLQIEPTHVPTRAGIDDWIEEFQSTDAARKSLGAYATPAPFSDVLARETLAPLLNKHAELRIVDPAAGAGSLLLAAHRCLVDAGHDPRSSICSLHGAELDPAARELCVLLLWTSAGSNDADLERITGNIRLTNAITFDWLSLEPFDVLLMNPPWESLRQERTDTEQAQVRADTLTRISRPAPGSKGLPPLYSAQGRGDRNLFKLFVELAPHLLRDEGRYGAVLPAAFGSDDGMTALRELYLTHFSLDRWTSFENRGKYFQIDSRYKFGLLTGSRSKKGTVSLDVLSFSTHPHEVTSRHIRLNQSDLEILGGKDRVIPELVTPAERDVLRQMLIAGTPLFQDGPLGATKYRREVDLTLGRKEEHFWHVDEPRPLATKGGQLSLEDQHDIVPVLEGRMIGQYDCFQKSWISGNGRGAVWESNGERPLAACQSQFVTHARQGSGARLAICDVTSSTNTRTVLAALVPPSWVCGNTAPVLVFETQEYALAALAIFNSMIFDWFARRVVGGLHLNKFYLARLTWPSLTSSDISRLAELGRTVAASSPRGGLNLQRGVSSGSVTSCLAEIEILTARGYDLNRDAVEAMFSPNCADRRGLWRYFKSSPIGREVAALAISGLPQLPYPHKTLAA